MFTAKANSNQTPNKQTRDDGIALLHTGKQTVRAFVSKVLGSSQILDNTGTPMFSGYENYQVLALSLSYEEDPDKRKKIFQILKTANDSICSSIALPFMTQSERTSCIREWVQQAGSECANMNACLSLYHAIKSLHNEVDERNLIFKNILQYFPLKNKNVLRQKVSQIASFFSKKISPESIRYILEDFLIPLLKNNLMSVNEIKPFLPVLKLALDQQYRFIGEIIEVINHLHRNNLVSTQDLVVNNLQEVLKPMLPNSIKLESEASIDAALNYLQSQHTYEERKVVFENLKITIGTKHHDRVVASLTSYVAQYRCGYAQDSSMDQFYDFLAEAFECSNTENQIAIKNVLLRGLQTEQYYCALSSLELVLSKLPTKQQQFEFVMEIYRLIAPRVMSDWDASQESFFVYSPTSISKVVRIFSEYMVIIQEQEKIEKSMSAIRAVLSQPLISDLTDICVGYAYQAKP